MLWSLYPSSVTVLSHTEPGLSVITQVVECSERGEIKEQAELGTQGLTKEEVNNHWKCDQLEMTGDDRVLLTENVLLVRRCLR